VEVVEVVELEIGVKTMESYIDLAQKPSTTITASTEC